MVNRQQISGDVLITGHVDALGGVGSSDLSKVVTEVQRTKSEVKNVSAKLQDYVDKTPVSRVFYNQPTIPYSIGDLWIRDNTLFIATVARDTGTFQETDWEWCIRSNVTTVLESTNGDVFKPGQSMTTTLVPRCFKNGLEITDSLPDSAFSWTRKSFYPQPSPNDDDTWNQNHAAGYRTIEVTADSIYARATYTVVIYE
jgi:hypothetical protein